MGIIRWLKGVAGRYSASQPLADDRPELPHDLKLARLLRAVREFPGRTEADLARIVYGRPDPILVAQDLRTLEAAGRITRDPESGRLHMV